MAIATLDMTSNLDNYSQYTLNERYEIQQQLGRQAGRRTFLARDLQTQELVIIKLVFFGSDFDWQNLKLFEREAETLKSLSHPAIPRYLDFFEVNSPELKGFALVQTYVEGKSLEEHLKAGRSFSESEVKQLAKALLEILAYLHDRQPPVIHRDIKPSNILLRDRTAHHIGNVYLVDFGSVQTLAATEGGTITVVGTYGYMPPEQFGGRAVPASDLYSLGATLIYIITGKHPADLPQYDFQIQFEQYCDRLSPVFINWLKLMTQPRLEKRLNSANKALQVLEQRQLRTDKIVSIPTQPVGSKIQMKKTADSLEILLPTMRANSTDVPWECVIVFLCVLMFSLNWVAGLLVGVGSFSILSYCFLAPMFEHTQLHLTRQELLLTYNFLGLKYARHPARIKDITKIEYVNRYFKKIGKYNTLTEVNPWIIIWAGTKKYQIGYTGNLSGRGLSVPELDWLAYELSEWLELPISQG